MNKGTEFRLIRSFNQSASINMAIDKALVTAFETDSKPILRVYTWEKSFTVGISQDPVSYARRYLEYNNNYAKRMTGGGILFHGHDLSYSLVLPPKLLEGFNVKQTYEKICSFLLAFYQSLGLNAKYAKDVEEIVLSKSDFCQVGYEAYDIIVNGVKIGGNAQKWAKKIIFQHGSIPIYSVNEQKELGSSLEDMGINISYEEAIEKLIDAFEKTFEVELKDSNLNEKENEKFQKLVKDINDSKI